MASSAITFRDVITRPPSHIGMPDVETFEQVIARFGVLDRESGGFAAREILVAVAQGGEELLTAQCAEPVRQRLRGAVSEAHRLAGWASGDVGLIDQCRWHMHRALDHARGQQERLAGVLASAGDMEKHYHAPNDALKLFQIATAGLPVNADPQSSAVLHGLAASAYLTLGHAEHACTALKQSRKLFAEVAEPAAALPFFAFYRPGHGLLAATEAKLADYELARADVQRALDTRPDYDVRRAGVFRSRGVRSYTPCKDEREDRGGSEPTAAGRPSACGISVGSWWLGALVRRHRSTRRRWPRRQRSCASPASGACPDYEP